MASSTAFAVCNIAATLAESDQLSELRRIVAELPGRGTVSEVAVMLPDGSVIAHTDANRINLRQLPASWQSKLPVGGVGGDRMAGLFSSAPGSAVERIELKRRGELIVMVRAVGAEARLGTWGMTGTTTLVFIGSGVIGLALLLGLYNRRRKSLNTLSLIADGLREFRNAPGELALLKLDERHGSEVAGFNQLLGLAQGHIRRATDRAALGPACNEVSAVQAVTDPGDHSNDIEQAINILPTGVLILDRSGTVKHANNMGSVLVGEPAATIRGKALTDLLKDEGLMEMVSGLRDGRANRRVLEHKRETPMGQAILRVQCRPLRSKDPGAALVTIEDITQQRVADASRGLFVAQATHELRTPLTNMRLAVETMMEDGRESMPPEMTPHLNMLSGEVRRLDRIVSEMLAVSEIESGSMKLTRGPVQLERLVAEVEADHRPYSEEKSVKFSVVLPAKYPQLYGDREKLAQALHNMVGNAIKYTPEGGSVTLSVQEIVDSRQLSFAVSDTGLGISVEDQKRLFTKFARGSDPRVAKITGTGLGLALSKEIAKLHGGDITVTSELDKGSTFTLLIPLGRSEQRAAA